jgi:hypothetical protein
VERRGTGDGAEAGIGVLAELAGGGEEGGKDGALLGAVSGAVAVGDLVVDDAGGRMEKVNIPDLSVASRAVKAPPEPPKPPAPPTGREHRDG